MIEAYFDVVDSVPLERCQPFIDAILCGASFDDALRAPALTAGDRLRIGALRRYSELCSPGEVARDLLWGYAARRHLDVVDVVWTGPRVAGVSGVRQTFPVARSIVAGATHHITVGGYVAKAEVLERIGIFSAIRRGVRVRVMSDRIDYNDRETMSLMAAGADIVDACPLATSMAKFHVKTIVADGAIALVTSANFTFLGQSENVELGLLVRGPSAKKVDVLLDYYARSLTAVSRAASDAV